ncbi:hypothetical protein CEP54_007498 [Fusarium duplospermum]|uniref:Uncharacterized protein n=1 Tax=Fusarium duplospermum TaxID=1325734 RepID=A0A428Q180_9HYPO|nr:hypothetical protein CEP54_007498 [Fusarium duplospermum]
MSPQESTPENESRHRTDTETYKAATMEFLDKAWGDEKWKPPTTIPRRDSRGEPVPPNHPWTVGELDVLKDITIAALGRDMFPLLALYEPGGAIFEAASESEQPRWCIKICAKARRMVRASAEPRLSKKEVFDQVMAGTLDGKVYFLDPPPSNGMKDGWMEVGCEEHRCCLHRQPSLQHKKSESDFRLSEDSRSKSSQNLYVYDLHAFWDWRDQEGEDSAE